MAETTPTETNFITNLSDHQVSQLTQQVIEHRNEAIEARADFPVRHDDRYRRYLSDPSLRPTGPWIDSARIFTPTTRDVLERLHAESWQAIFGDIMQISASPWGDEDIENADMATRFMRWALEQTMSWTDVSMDLLFDALLDSVGVAKCYAWAPPWGPPSEQARRYLQRTARIDALDLGMLLVAPDAEGLQYPEGRYVAQEFFLSSDDLLRMEQRGYDIPALDELGYSQELTDRKRTELEREGERVVEFKPDSIPFVEQYERFVINDDGRGLETDVIVSWFPDAQIDGTSHNASANHGRLSGIRKLIDVFPQDDRPRRPFFPLTFWPQPRQWRGLNVPDRLETMQDIVNRLYEQMINYGEVTLLPFIFANSFYTGEIPDLHTIRPGSIVTVDDVSQMQFSPLRNTTRPLSEEVQMIQGQIERDSQVVDFSGNNLTRQRGSNRTATGTMAIINEVKRSYSMLVRRATAQAQVLLSFKFRLWQEILPDGAMVQIYDREEVVSDMESAEANTLWDRIFQRKPLSDVGQPRRENLLAQPTSRDSISGIYDVKIEVNPEAQIDRQILMSLYQLTAPAVQDYPAGNRLMLKRIWAAHGQQGFDDIYPEEIALLQTQQRVMTIQAQLAVAQQQLDDVAQQEAQAELDEFEQELQKAGQTGEVSPELAQMAHNLMARNGSDDTGGEPIG